MGLALFALILLPFSILFNAFVLTELWTWFIVPLGVSAIGMAHAYGITLVVRFMTYQFNVAKEKEGKDALISAISIAVFMPLMAWGFGALAHYFM